MARVEKTLWIWLTGWVLVAGFAQMQIEKKFRWPFPPVNTMVPTENYSTDLGAILLGTRRLATDIAYVQFLQYYGRRQEDEEEGHEKHSHFDSDAGVYPELLTFGRRMARLDPFFHSAILEVSGSLAFNQKRVAESLSLLQEAIELDPMYYRYRLYAAAILYKSEGQDDKLIDILAEAVRFPDSPYMLKNILAILYKKRGRYVESAKMRLLMMETGPGL